MSNPPDYGARNYGHPKVANLLTNRGSIRSQGTGAAAGAKEVSP